MEQVEAYTSEDGKMEMPIYNLPPKILCDVVYVNLKAEAGTDEVFAQITLQPKSELDDLSLEVGNSPPLPQNKKVISFSKKLTPYDTSTHGLSVPKKNADECLPPLDMSLDLPLQELVAKDLHGLEWRFRHIYRGRYANYLSLIYRQVLVKIFIFTMLNSYWDKCNQFLSIFLLINI